MAINKDLHDRLKILKAIQPQAPGAQDFKAMDARQEMIEILYLLAGRDKPDHSMHGLLTGLYQEVPF